MLHFLRPTVAAEKLYGMSRCQDRPSSRNWSLVEPTTWLERTTVRRLPPGIFYVHFHRRFE